MLLAKGEREQSRRDALLGRLAEIAALGNWYKIEYYLSSSQVE
jgi:hypothetical protein